MAGVVGPMAITQLRASSVCTAVHQLAAKVDPDAFHHQFGAPLSDLDQLIASKTVTIAKLMAIAPEGTLGVYVV